MSKKNSIYISLLIIISCFLLNLNVNPIPGQENLQEVATVIAVEVPVRVISKGQFVKNLTKEDFEIFENGIKQEITAFEIVSRKISIPEEISPEELKIPPKKRLFILIFNIFDYNDSVGEGIDYFFENVFRKGDQIIILSEDRLLNIELGKGLPGMILDLKETLKEYKKISSKETLKKFDELKIEADRILSPTGRGENPAPKILIFYDNYQRIWNEYKRQYIYPDIDLYKSVMNRVKQIEGEKWVLCFQQREMFPKMKSDGPLLRQINSLIGSAGIWGKLIQAKQTNLQISFDYSPTFPTEMLKDLFMEANITFHLILLKSLRNLLSQDFEMRDVAMDYEDCFKQISSATGGYSTFSNKVAEALQEATKTEDFHYLLVYSPKENPEIEKRDIKVKVKRKAVKVVHLKSIREIQAPPITISDFKVNQKTISFTLINYKRANIENELTGIAEIKITIFDENSNKVFDEGKTLNILEVDTHVSLNFDWLKSGSYFIIIQAIDKISNDVDVFSRVIEL